MTLQDSDNSVWLPQVAVPSQLAEQLTVIAKTSQLSVEQVINQILAQYLGQFSENNHPLETEEQDERLSSLEVDVHEVFCKLERQSHEVASFNLRLQKLEQSLIGQRPLSEKRTLQMNSSWTEPLEDEPDEILTDFLPDSDDDDASDGDLYRQSLSNDDEPDEILTDFLPES